MDDDWRERLVVHPAKLVHYILAPDHPVGGSKARFFIRLGYRAASPAVLEFALLEHGRQGVLTEVEETEYGTLRVVEGRINTPRASDVLIRSIWMEPGPNRPVHLVTAYPGRGTR